MAFYQRNLPHWQPPGATFFITWRLAGSLPQTALKQLEAQRRLLEREQTRAGESEDARKIRHFKKLFTVYDACLDRAESGPLWLKDERRAALVEETLLQHYCDLYQLWAYVVMANQVHVFLQPKVAQTSVCADTVAATSAQTKVCATGEPQYIALPKITQALKGRSALEANRLLARSGQTFWQDESYDHWARDEDEFYRIIAYIENNPVKAGLVTQLEDWPWSSATERKRRGFTTIKSLT